MFFYIILTVLISLASSDPTVTLSTIATAQDVFMTPKPSENILPSKTRRILYGRNVGETRPYMVYLRSASIPEDNDDIFRSLDPATWLCGGVIIHEKYVLTSAACIEDAKHFYVISGTHRWVDMEKAETDECIQNGQKRAVWKCVPKSYSFDGMDFDNIRWMVNDLAVVKVSDEFNFEKRIKGCDFVPQKVAYNNNSLDFEKAGTVASIAGWGSTGYFSDIAKVDRGTLIPTTTPEDPNDALRYWTPPVTAPDKDTRRKNEDKTKMDKRSRASSEEETPGWLRAGLSPAEMSQATHNSPELLETEVVILSKKMCKKKWPQRYGYIIDAHMICGKDNTDIDSMSKACSEHEVDCKELAYSQEDDTGEDERRHVGRVYSLRRQYSRYNQRRSKMLSGGFCENDHGGPLIVGYGKTSIVIGVISACMTTPPNNKCRGPFLYTSVYNNRHLISCAIDKEIGNTCKNLLRSSQTHMHETELPWPDSSNKQIGRMSHNHSDKEEDEDEDEDDKETYRKAVEVAPEETTKHARFQVETNEYPKPQESPPVTEEMILVDTDAPEHPDDDETR